MKKTILFLLIIAITTIALLLIFQHSTYASSVEAYNISEESFSHFNSSQSVQSDIDMTGFRDVSSPVIKENQNDFYIPPIVGFLMMVFSIICGVISYNNTLKIKKEQSKQK